MEDNLLVKLITSGHQNLNFDVSDDSKWLKEFKKLNSAYDNLKTLETLHFDLSNLTYYIKQKNPRLAEQICGAFSSLLYDTKFNNFVLVHEIQVEYKESLSKIFNQQYPNIYDTVRNALVKENTLSEKSQWSVEIEQKAISFIKEFCQKTFRLNIARQEISIKDNTGNITNVVLTTGHDSTNNSTEFFLRENLNAERLKHNNKPIVAYSKKTNANQTIQDLYSFNGRFHTIVLNASVDIHRYIPIQFHMQYLWFYLIKINKILDELNDDLNRSNQSTNMKEKVNLINILINKIEMLTMFNETFKFAIEIDKENIYQKIESRWNIEAQLEQSNKYISFFKDYLVRLHETKSAEIDNKRNIILFIITTLQFLALISIWNDYLSLLQHEGLHKTNRLLISIFNTDTSLKEFHSFLPISLIALLGLLIGYIFTKKTK